MADEVERTDGGDDRCEHCDSDGAADLADAVEDRRSVSCL
jgi:hypothetical protein